MKSHAKSHTHLSRTPQNQLRLIFLGTLIIMIAIVSGIISQRDYQQASAARADEIGCYIGKACDVPTCNQEYGGDPANCDVCGGGWCSGGSCATCGDAAIKMEPGTGTTCSREEIPECGEGDAQVGDVCRCISQDPNDPFIGRQLCTAEGWDICRRVPGEAGELPPTQPVEQENNSVPNTGQEDDGDDTSNLQPDASPTQRQVPEPSPRQPTEPESPPEPQPAINATTVRIINQDTVGYEVTSLKVCPLGRDCQYLDLGNPKPAVDAADDTSTVDEEELVVATECPTDDSLYFSVYVFLTQSEDQTTFVKTVYPSCGTMKQLVLATSDQAELDPDPSPEPTELPTQPRAGDDHSDTPIIPRDQWSSRPPNAQAAHITQETITHIVVHHLGSGAYTDYDPLAIQRHHMSHNGWYDVAYHYIIQANPADNGATARIYKGRDERICGDTGTVYNADPEHGLCNALHVVVTGDFDIYTPQRSQMNALIVLLKQLSNEHSVAPEHIYGHRDLVTQSYTCPGENLYRYQQQPAMEYIRSQLE